jgi:hypothetical protein
MYDSKTSANLEYANLSRTRMQQGGIYLQDTGQNKKDIVKGRKSDFSGTYFDSFAIIVKVYSEQTILEEKTNNRVA